MIKLHQEVLVCVCVEVIKKASDICLFRAAGQQTQVGLYQTEMCLFLKVICSSQIKFFFLFFLWHLGEI